MNRRERDKGARGQRSVRQLFEQYGWTMTATASTRRRPSGTCDYLAIRSGVVLALEVKNQAVLRLPLWRRQTLANAPEGTVPVLVYKSGHVWLAEWHENRLWWAVPAVTFAKEGTATLACPF